MSLHTPGSALWSMLAHGMLFHFHRGWEFEIYCNWRYWEDWDSEWRYSTYTIYQQRCNQIRYGRRAGLHMFTRFNMSFWDCIVLSTLAQLSTKIQGSFGCFSCHLFIICTDYIYASDVMQNSFLSSWDLYNHNKNPHLVCCTVH